MIPVVSTSACWSLWIQTRWPKGICLLFHSHKERLLKGKWGWRTPLPIAIQQGLCCESGWVNAATITWLIRFQQAFIDSLLPMLMCLQGCYSAVVDYFELYIYVAGASAIVVLTIEVLIRPLVVIPSFFVWCLCICVFFIWRSPGYYLYTLCSIQGCFSCPVWMCTVAL